MKKIKAVVAALAVIFAGQGVFAQGYPVLDVANLNNAINELYAYYQQIQNTIEQVQNTYTQIQQAAQQMQTMNLDDLSSLGKNFEGLSENPFEVITAVHKSAKDVTTAVNKQMNKINDLTDALTKETISFGGMDISVADLCGVGTSGKNLAGFVQNAWDATVESGSKAVAGYVGKLSYKDKQKIMKKYGMSPENFATLELANYQLSESVKNGAVFGSTEGMKNLYSEIQGNSAAIQTMAQNLPDGSIYAATQMNTTALASVERMTGKMVEKMQGTFGLIANKIAADKAEKAIKEQAKLEEKQEQQEAMRSASVDDSGYY